jgi:hypothetical protein
LPDVPKVLLGRKLIAMNTHSRKEEESKSDILRFYLRKPENAK